MSAAAPHVRFFPSRGKTAVAARTRGRRPQHRVAQVRNPDALRRFSAEALQRAYDAGLPSRSMYGRVQEKRRVKQFNVAACEAVVHESGATNFDVSVPVPYSIFSRLPHGARILACDHPGRPDRVPSLVVDRRHARNVTRPPIEGKQK